MKHPKLSIAVIVIAVPLLCLSLIETFLRLNKEFQWFFINDRVQLPSTYQVPYDAVNEAEVKQLIAAEIKSYPDYPTRKNEDELMKEGLDISRKAIPDIYASDRSYLQNLKYTAHLTSKKTQTVIYHADISFDQYGLRNVPGRPRVADKQYIFAGCSFTYGEGVNDDETFPGQFQKLRPDSQVYNFGLGGEGGNDILYELQYGFNQRYEKIPVKNATFIYMFISDHFRRAICPVSCLTPEWDWLLLHHRYEWDENQKLTYRGIFRDRLIRNKIYSLFSKLELRRVLGLDWPLLTSDETYDFYVELVRMMKDVAIEKLKVKEFYVALHPFSTNPTSPGFEDRLRKAGIAVLDSRVANLSELMENKANIPVDRHPTPLAHKIHALLLDRELKKIESKQRVDEVNASTLRSRQQNSDKQ